MEKNSEKYLQTFRSLLITHALFVLIFGGVAAICTVWTGNAVSVALGVLLGGLGGGLQIVSLSYSIPRAVMHHPGDAQKYMLKHYILRLLIMLVLLFFGVLKGKWMLVGIALGLLCVKLGGFFAPSVERKLYKKQ